MTLKIGVLSDTHFTPGSGPLPSSMMNALADCQLILHAGDWVDVCVKDALEEIGELNGVFGNMDGHPIRSVYPEVQELNLEGFKIGMTHGWGPPQRIEKRILSKFSQKQDLIIYGHTHEAVFHESDGQLFLNPGSPTDTLRASRTTFAILTLGEKIKAEIKTVPS